MPAVGLKFDVTFPDLPSVRINEKKKIKDVDKIIFF
jgi:hypothetical protein